MCVHNKVPALFFGSQRLGQCNSHGRSPPGGMSCPAAQRGSQQPAAPHPKVSISGSRAAERQGKARQWLFRTWPPPPAANPAERHCYRTREPAFSWCAAVLSRARLARPAWRGAFTAPAGGPATAGPQLSLNTCHLQRIQQALRRCEHSSFATIPANLCPNNAKRVERQQHINE